MNIDANAVIQKLADRVTALTIELSVLQATNEALQAEVDAAQKQEPAADVTPIKPEVVAQ